MKCKCYYSKVHLCYLCLLEFETSAGILSSMQAFHLVFAQYPCHSVDAFSIELPQFEYINSKNDTTTSRKMMKMYKTYVWAPAR